MLYDILKDFKGSQDGRFSESFKAGTQAELSDYLASCVDPSWIKPATKMASEVENKAIPTTGKQGDTIRNKAKK